MSTVWSWRVASGGSSRAWKLMSRPDCWSLAMDFWKTVMSFGMVIMVALTPWDAKSLARSIIGIKWPPPTNGKKNISTLRPFTSIDALVVVVAGGERDGRIP